MTDSRVFGNFYKLEHVLGDGNFAVVRQCEEIATGKKFAVKCVKKSTLNSKDLSNLQREMKILKEVRVSNIINTKPLSSLIIPISSVS